MLLAAGVHVPSGAHTHGIDDLSVPIRDQPSVKTPVRIGAGTWIGSAAVVLADVGRDAVIAAGAVVTRPIPDRTIAGGVPARVLRHREPAIPRDGMTCASSSSPIGCRTRPIAAIGCARIHMLQRLRDARGGRARVAGPRRRGSSHVEEVRAFVSRVTTAQGSELRNYVRALAALPTARR